MGSSAAPALVRCARPGDGPVLAALSVELGYPATAAEVARRLDPLLASPEHEVLVAEDAAGRVVGWIHAFVSRRLESEPFAELGGLVVAAAHRGQGVGRALVAGAEAWAAGRGMAKLRVRSRASRSGAHRFYERLGFVNTKVQEVFDKPLTAADP